MKSELPVAEPQAFTVEEFCARNRTSKWMFYNLLRQGRGPRLMSLGRSIRISIEAERDWRAEREKPDDTEARLIRREAEARARNASRAGKKAAASPNHVSKRPRSRVEG